MHMMLAIALSALAGLLVGVTCCEATIRHLRRRVKQLRQARSSESAELQAVANLTNHEKALYYEMLDELENGEAKRHKPPERKNILRSVTRFLFVVPPICAIIWVFWTYGIATYSTVVLQQPFPVESLSIQAVITLLGVSGMKVVENIFEHNDGVVFGQSKTEDDPPDSGGEEGGVG